MIPQPASPLPWHVHEIHHDDGWGSTFVVANTPQGQPLTDEHALFSPAAPGPFDKKLKDAAYLVHAANLFPEAIKASQLFVKWASALQNIPGGLALHESYYAALALLKKAEQSP